MEIKRLSHRVWSVRASSRKNDKKEESRSVTEERETHCKTFDSMLAD